eukprot:CAMPEP_0197823392 /NCGR_PEP_ID=MMETSP1437-20131217/721_1 /TAXON_ID=49252 ORGANISM="Eucampia antarctica, Strain CCMP1452" /NCGR_SAMPLE_ID=MMETSP1437 /ASSEMBLY_ACC=CAM_ASM_001096 /LENGTH=1035 /DNA_ID=CAMNT_0043422531 /DNA_START=141 /DNA_END=3248 /DNA_ORIENTATION=+
MSTSSALGGARESASGLLAMLSEPDVTLQSHALHKLLEKINVLWHEVAEVLPELESIAEESTHPARQVAAAVASRVFFHLEEPVQALRLALESSEQHFDVVRERQSPYVTCLTGAAVDAYIKKKQKQTDELSAEQEDDDESSLDLVKLQKVVELMLERCFADGHYTHALGVALEAREVDKVKQILERCVASCEPSKVQATLKYALDAASSHQTASKKFCEQVLQILVVYLEKQISSQLYKAEASIYYCQANQMLRNAPPVSQMITSLLNGPQTDILLGLQLCFDLVDSGDQNFVHQVSEGISQEHTAAKRVLTGGFVSELALSFLHKNSDSDKLIMENLKKALEERGAGRNSVLHNCAVATHAYLNAGTTNDSFLRDHLDWMKKASNWAKFSATASLGVVHAGHTTEAMSLLEPYLPSSPNNEEGENQAVSATGGFAEGGSLYALGLVHGSHVGSSWEKRKEACDFLRQHLRASHANETISHGAALGVGLTAFGTNSLEVINELKELLYTDSAVAGESAGVALGMVLVGSGAGNLQNSINSTDKEEIAELLTELKNYARETHHEKLIRGIALGIALMNYGQEENADATIEEMRSDRDPILRYGAQYALALAYCGTGSNKAIRILLHTAVSDVSDDVRMAAVIGLAFVLYKTPERVPQLVKLLLESFNPHVRYASCMAVGIAMAGSGDTESIALLEPMLDDMTDFVRQGALIGTSLIYMQQSDSCNSRKIKSFRERLSSIVGDKHQSTLTKMGAILSTGIIDAGGRNCCLDLGSRNGFTKMNSAIGLALWLQHWHWYPMMHMLSLALTPTSTIGLNKDFQYPKNFEIICNSKPSSFAYPKRLEEKKEEKKKRVETVTLSTTAKNKARLARKRAKEDAELGGGAAPMAVDDKKEDEDEVKVQVKTEGEESMDIDAVEEVVVDIEEKKSKKKRDPEPTSHRLSNPCRVTKAQAEVCVFDLKQRYCPIIPNEKPFGVIMLTDHTPEEEEDLGTVKAPSVESEDEADAPEPFEWTPPDHPDLQIDTTSSEADKEVVKAPE